MAKVSELKDRARQLEQQGELAKAQAIYQHILKHLEGTPALKGELPLYVKVGDLALKQGDPTTAVAMYDQAAGHYARAGSAKSIGALAEKIRRADPTRDDAAVQLGKALLSEGHTAAAAEVIGKYARRLGRSDVEDVLATVEGEQIPAAARARVARALTLLATAPEEPMAAAGPEDRAAAAALPGLEPSAPPAAAGEAFTSSLSDLLAASPSAPPQAPATPEPSHDLPLIIEHGALEPRVAPPPRHQPEPPPWPEPEPVPVTYAEPMAERQPAPRFEVPAEPEPEPALGSSVAPDGTPEVEPAPPARVEPERRVVVREPRVLVREHSRPRDRRRRRLLVAGIVLVIVVGGIGGAWALGWRPFGEVEPSDGDEPSSTVPTFPASGGSAVGANPAPTAGDTTAFGPLGFNALVDTPASARPGRGTARVPERPGGPDTVPVPVLPPSGPPPEARPAALATVVVPPGYAIADEIVVIPGLRVLSVAETRVGGAQGHRVVQQAEGGVEVRLVATAGDFGADTLGLGAVHIESEGDTVAVGSVRLGRYLVDARAAMPTETLAAYLRQLIRARPVS